MQRRLIMLREPFAETVAEPLPMMLWRARPDMSCEFVSRQWLDFTGCRDDQALGDGWSRPIHPEDLARWLDTCVRSFDAREPFEIEYRLRRRDGEYRWVLDRALPRYSKDAVFVGFVGTCIDIDERKRAEHELARSLERERKLRIATEEASRLKDGFLASVLSDLESQVQAVATWAAHLRGQIPGEPARALDAIERNARAQERIISSLLEVSRLAAGRQALPGATAAASARAGTAPLLGGVRVLIVDDDAAAREGMAKMLGIAGAQTHGASSSSEALDALNAFRPDVMLSDVHMQGGEGYFLIRAVRALPAERGGCLRAAALTNQGEPEDGVRAVAAGYDAQLAKPVEPVALLATVARLAQPASM
jgi:PAS domain S-box-containing protein